jgi:hypothetical protein
VDPPVAELSEEDSVGAPLFAGCSYEAVIGTCIQLRSFGLSVPWT